MQSCVCRFCFLHCLSALFTLPCRSAALSGGHLPVQGVQGSACHPLGSCSMQSFKTSERRAGAKQFQAVQHLQDACEPESFCEFLVSFWLGCVSWLVAVSALSASVCPSPQPYACPCCSPWTRLGCDKHKSRKRSSQWQLSAPHLITETLLLS